MFNLRSASKSPFGAQLPQGGIQMPNVDPALMQQAAQSPARRGLFGGLRDRVMGQREDGSTFRDRLMMAGMALQGDGRGAAAYGANLQEQQRAQQETQQAVEQRRQRMQQAVQLVQNVAPDNRALMNAAMMDPDAVLERYLGNMEASNVSAGSTRINPLTGQNYTAPEMFRQDGLYGTQTPDGVTFNDQDALAREGMAADVASTRAGTQNTLDQVRSRREGDALAQAEFDREANAAPWDDVNSLRGDAEGDLNRIRFREVESSFQRVVDSAREPSAAGDLALIFNYMKMLDPGSTVREGEFANAQNAGGASARARAAYNSILDGTRLTDEQRSDFLGRAEQLYQGQRQIAEQRLAPYQEQAQQRFGEQYQPYAVPQLLDVGGRGQASQSGPREGQTATNPQTGEQIVFRNGQWQPR